MVVGKKMNFVILFRFEKQEIIYQIKVYFEHFIMILMEICIVHLAENQIINMLFIIV